MNFYINIHSCFTTACTSVSSLLRESRITMSNYRPRNREDYDFSTCYPEQPLYKSSYPYDQRPPPHQSRQPTIGPYPPADYLNVQAAQQNQYTSVQTQGYPYLQNSARYQPPPPPSRYIRHSQATHGEPSSSLHPMYQDWQPARQNWLQAAQDGVYPYTYGYEPPQDLPLRKGLSSITTALENAPDSLNMQHSSFEVPISKFHNSTGRRRALLIGINYSGHKELKGCVQDVKYIAHLLISRFKFRREEMLILTDEPHDVYGVKSGKPTRYQMLKAMEWLMRGADHGDSLFFHFSGHGTSVPDEDGDEADGFDETICPVDYENSGMITDDELYYKMIVRVPRGARFTAIMDCCHSGTAMDLPYIYDVENGEMRDDRLEVVGFREGRLKRTLQKVGLRRKRPKRKPRPNSKGGEALLISGCRDFEVSCDTDELAGVPTGAMTFCIVEAIERGIVREWNQYTYQSLLNAMNEKLEASQYSQKPQFSTAHPFNISSPFRL